jgi:hypothetical protein
MTRGLRFCKVDLHVHTPASQCFIEEGITPQDIVDQALTQDLAAIGITDHNTGAWVDLVKSAAADTHLVVFPGVEISVAPGVHVVALFPLHCTAEHINHLLSQLDIPPDQRGDSTALVTRYGVQQVVKMISNNSALPVLAHIDDVKGAWNELEGQTRLQLWQQAPFAAVEIVGDALPAEIGHAPYNRQPAYYWASDNPHPQQPTKHSHLGIGTRYSCFKLDEPVTWEGLRLCFDDPELRICRTMSAVAHPVIERVQVSGGFLGGLDIELNPNLNCLIGGRGTGKSALLELIRHVMDTPAKTEENKRQAQSLLKQTFPKGVRASTDVRVDDVRYRVVRTSGREPEVKRLDTVTDSEDCGQYIDVVPGDLLPLQVYGQKEIYQISLDPEFQLRLLDNYVAGDLKALKEEESDLLRDLRTNAETILRLVDEVQASQESLRNLAAIEEEIRRMEALDFVDRVKEKELYDREKRLLDNAQEQIETLLTAIRAFPEQHRLDIEALNDEALDGLPNRDVLQEERTLLEAINAMLDDRLSDLLGAVEDRWKGGGEKREIWKRAYSQQQEAYGKILEELAEEGEIAPDRYIQLQERKADLEDQSRQVAQYEADIDAALEQRKKWLGQLRRVRRKQYEVRCEKAKALSQALNGNVRITVWSAGHRKAYKKYLRELFRGLDVRDPTRSELADVEAAEPEQEAQAPREIDGHVHHLVPEIPRYLDPIELAEAIRAEQQREDEESSVLEQRFGVDSAAMRRNMSGLSREKLFELQLFKVPDLPIIELQVGSGLLGYRSLEHLSVGQKCTALLSIILLESDVPLLIDQPEDDLDNQFIFDQIVATLRREKEQRQFIIASHNANIPVSGDAELIVVLEADEKHGQIAEDGLGSIDVDSIKDFVTRILEGGREAFRIRREKYGKMIEG